jgi:hypothetical protein
MIELVCASIILAYKHVDVCMSLLYLQCNH